MRVRFGDGLVTFEVDDDSAVGRQVRFDQLVAEARAQMARYPQYDDYFDSGWRLAVATKNLSTKGGLSFERGESYIARIEDDPDDEFYGRVFGWSRLRAIAVLVPAGVLDFVGAAV